MNESSAVSNTRLGTFLSVGSPAIVEMAAECGFDWLLLDFEHGCETETVLPHLLRAAKGAPTQAIVRLGAAHPEAIGRALDWGAHGIMIPHVNDAAEARLCVQAMYHPPRGKRGVSRSVRACGYGLRPPEKPGDVAPPVFMAQIETIEAVERAAEIAGVDGVDVLFVGPADLGFDLRARPEKAVRLFEECLAHVASAARTAGKASGILARDPADVPKFQTMGFTHIAVDSDIAILRKGFLSVVQGTR